MNMDIYSPSHPTDDVDFENDIDQDKKEHALTSQKERDSFEGVFKEIVSQMTELKRCRNNISEERRSNIEQDEYSHRDDIIDQQYIPEREMSSELQYRKNVSRESRERSTSESRSLNDRQSKSTNISDRRNIDDIIELNHMPIERMPLESPYWREDSNESQESLTSESRRLNNRRLRLKNVDNISDKDDNIVKQYWRQREIEPESNYRRSNSREIRQNSRSVGRESSGRRSRSRSIIGSTFNDSKHSDLRNELNIRSHLKSFFGNTRNSKNKKFEKKCLPADQYNNRIYGGKLPYDDVTSEHTAIGFDKKLQLSKKILKGFQSDLHSSSDILNLNDPNQINVDNIRRQVPEKIWNRDQSRSEIVGNSNKESIIGIEVEHKIFPFIKKVIDPFEKEMEFRLWDMQTSLLPEASENSYMDSKQDDFYNSRQNSQDLSSIDENYKRDLLTWEDIKSIAGTANISGKVLHKFDEENYNRGQEPELNLRCQDNSRNISAISNFEKYSNDEFGPLRHRRNLISSMMAKRLPQNTNQNHLTTHVFEERSLSNRINYNNSNFNQFQRSPVREESFINYQNNILEENYNVNFNCSSPNPQVDSKQFQSEVYRNFENRYAARKDFGMMQVLNGSETMIPDMFTNDFVEDLENCDNGSKNRIKYPILQDNVKNTVMMNAYEDNSDDEFDIGRDDRHIIRSRPINHFSDIIGSRFEQRSPFPDRNDRSNNNNFGSIDCDSQNFLNDRSQRLSPRSEYLNNNRNNNFIRNDPFPYLRPVFHDDQSNDIEDSNRQYLIRNEARNIQASETMIPEQLPNDFNEAFGNEQIERKEYSIFDINVNSNNDFDARIIERMMTNLRRTDEPPENMTKNIISHGFEREAQFQNINNHNYNNFEPNFRDQHNFQNQPNHDNFSVNSPNNHRFTSSYTDDFHNAPLNSTDDMLQQLRPQFNHNNFQVDSRDYLESENSMSRDIQTNPLLNVSEIMISERIEDNVDENVSNMQQNAPLNEDNENNSSSINVPEENSNNEFGTWQNERVKENPPEERSPQQSTTVLNNSNFVQAVSGSVNYDNDIYQKQHNLDESCNNDQNIGLTGNFNAHSYLTNNSQQQLRPQFNFNPPQWNPHCMTNNMYPPIFPGNFPFQHDATIRQPIVCIPQFQRPMMPPMSFIPPPPPPPPPPPSTSFESHIPPLPPTPIAEETDTINNEGKNLNQELDTNKPLNNIAQSLSLIENRNLLETLMTQAGLSSEKLKFSQKDISSKLSSDTFSNILKSAATSVISRLVETSIKPKPMSDSMSMSPPSPPTTPPIHQSRKSKSGFLKLPLPNYSDDQKPESSENALDKDKQVLRSYYECKNDWQERVALEVKTFLKPAFISKIIDKNDYKEIMKRCVTKITKSGVAEINKSKIEKFVLSYVDKYIKGRNVGQHIAVSSSGNAV